MVSEVGFASVHRRSKLYRLKGIMIPTDKDMFCLALVASFIFMLQEMYGSESPMEQVVSDEERYMVFDTESEDDEYGSWWCQDYGHGPVVHKLE